MSKINSLNCIFIIIRLTINSLLSYLLLGLQITYYLPKFKTIMAKRELSDEREYNRRRMLLELN